MLISSLKAIFRPIVFIAKNIIEDVVFYGQESADFMHNLCLSKFNDWLGLFTWIAVTED